MFKFLKDKIKNTISGISEKILGKKEEIPEQDAVQESQHEIDEPEILIEQPQLDEEIPEPNKKEIKPAIEIISSEIETKPIFNIEISPEEQTDSLIDEPVEDQTIDQTFEEEIKPVEQFKSYGEVDSTEDFEEEKLEKESKPTIRQEKLRTAPKILAKDKTTQEKQSVGKDTSFSMQDLLDEEIEKPMQKPLEKHQEKPIEKKIEKLVSESKLVESEAKKQIVKESKPVKKEVEIVKPSISKPIEEKPAEKKGFFQRITQAVQTTSINSDQFNELFWDLEVALLENNVAVEVIEKVKKDLENSLVGKPIKRGKLEDTIQKSLKSSVEEILKQPAFSLDNEIKNSAKKPYIICFVGINGSGKTTTIAKLAHHLKSKGFSVVLAAADTFRAAAIDQLQEHADRLNLKLIKHDYGSDPAAVAFDAIKHAESKKTDVVLIDTAGRMHSNQNLQDEMKKIIKVAKPDLKIFVGESITGNDCVEQAKRFNESISIDGIILAKADIDEKGGAALSVSYVTGKPIFYLGTGQNYEDIEQFDPEIVVKNLGLA